jgi:hypothetical protein
MEELRNLQQIYSLAAGRFNQYDGKDFILPQMFKEQVKEINSNTISYNEYSAIIETRGNQNGVLNIFLPNQWFYIASYFTDFYNELQRYKKEALKIVSKERLKELNGSSLTEQEENRLQQLSLDETSKSYLVRFMTDYSWWSGAKTIDRGDFYVSPILNSARLVNASQSFVADLCAFLADKKELVDSIINGEEKGNYTYNHPHIIHWIQKIYFGTPGSGKSWTIKEKYEKDETKVIRTTFHPDTDYAQFVGCYKPKTYEEDGKKKISYEFTPQAFTEAYVKAWSDLEHPYYLIIEEINRGNCAQIFGDLFQLLDRNKEGYSEYPIKADNDLKDYLIGHLPKDSEGIKDGKLCLPPNLSIIASMNTSDQSLFPMDSAFKRRWAWEYVPIDYNNVESAKFEINIGGQPENWHEFLKKINEKIKKVTSSEDKQMGNFFIKGSINEKEFCDKVMFYLWSEVGKDNYQTNDAIFKYYAGEEKEPKEFSFNELYNSEKRMAILKGFIRYIKESEA